MAVEEWAFMWLGVLERPKWEAVFLWLWALKTNICCLLIGAHASELTCLLDSVLSSLSRLPDLGVLSRLTIASRCGLTPRLQDYFSKQVGPVKKVLLNYNKNGRSVGVVTIIFSQPQSAARAAKELNSVKVDGKPIKVEVILGASFVPAPSAPKSLGDRIQAPKAKKDNNKPKSAAAAPKPAATAGGATKAAGRGARKARAGRPKPKTVEELDAEMSEYFDPNAAAPAANNNGAPAPTAAPATGDATMEDEIM
ncbi:hypothetical protein E4T47_06905 [Aureobasidium subglaciale]|nr:hypothetical protein E4T43_06865 [Aureobasidium subglaciale]KAI5269665.1 hypothetical protein E4T47_06905 [Aureobasidium subglaciale]